MTHYTKGISGAAPFRARLTQITCAQDAAVILAELCVLVGGKEGKERFLTNVENDNQKNSVEPGERHGQREEGLKSPVDLGTLAPVAVP